MGHMSKLQSALKVPKKRRNTFGNYNYRSAEDILEAVKPLLAAEGLAIILNDDIVQVGDRVYVRCTARVMSDNTIIAEATGYAREPQTKKGMDDSQITGATASYARKYALGGLFAIDDTADADAYQPTVEDAINAINGVKSRQEFEQAFIAWKQYFDGNAKFMDAAKEVAKKYPKP